MHSPRQRPLTWLFIAASGFVDVVLAVLAHQHSLYAGILVGLLLGQVAAQASWVGTGPVHRLLRATWLVVCLVVLSFASIAMTRTSYGELFALWAGYAALVFFTVFIVRTLRGMIGPRNNSGKDRWQMPLIEIFGWTLVVAIASFASRSMKITVWQQGLWPMVLTWVAIPCLAVLLLEGPVKRLWLTRSLPVILAGGWFGRYTDFESTFTLTLYMIAWLGVLRIDRQMAEVRARRSGDASLNGGAAADSPSTTVE